MRHLTVLGLICLALAAPASAATPQGLYNKLLTTSYGTPPDGFYGGTVGRDTLGDKDKRHHAIGAVLVSFDSEGYVSYVIYPSKDAVASRFAEKPSSDDPEVKKFEVRGKVPGYWNTRSVWIDATLEGKNAFGKTVQNGATILNVQRHNVVVVVATISTDTATSGDVPGALRLLKSAIAHLERLGG